MELNRPEIKRQAKGLIRQNKQLILLATVILLALGLVMGGLSIALSGVSISEMTNYYGYTFSGDYAQASVTLSKALPDNVPGYVEVIDAAMSYVLLIIEVGYLILLMNAARGRKAEYGNLLDGFAHWWRIILLNLVRAGLIFLWSLLLIVPGIVAAYRYQFAFQVLLDHPDYGIIECLRESKELTNGHKWQLFVLDWSFFGWYLLEYVAILVGALVAAFLPDPLRWVVIAVFAAALPVWLTPYQTLVDILYYEKLGGQAEAAPAQEPWET